MVGQHETPLNTSPGAGPAELTWTFIPFKGFLCSLHRQENNFTRYLEGLPCLTPPAEQLGLQWLPNPGKHC